MKGSPVCICMCEHVCFSLIVSDLTDVGLDTDIFGLCCQRRILNQSKKLKMNDALTSFSEINKTAPFLLRPVVILRVATGNFSETTREAPTFHTIKSQICTFRGGVACTREVHA